VAHSGLLGGSISDLHSLAAPTRIRADALAAIEWPI